MTTFIRSIAVNRAERRDEVACSPVRDERPDTCSRDREDSKEKI